MYTIRNTRRFRINPVELAVFAVITTVFFHSVYHLFHDPNPFQTSEFTPAASNLNTGNRALAATTQSLLNLQIQCNGDMDQQTSALKVRLIGTLCGIKTPVEHEKLVKTAIINHANKFAATVFSDLNSGKYSTDYIPLSNGKNPIHIEFAYQDGRLFIQEVTIIKN